MTDPHSDEYCVVCGIKPTSGRAMHPVVSIDDGCICEVCVDG